MIFPVGNKRILIKSDRCEWTFRRTMDHLGLFTEQDGWSDPVIREAFTQHIVDHHLKWGAWNLNEQNDYGDLIMKFLSCRPDGIAFNAEGRECVFLEFTCPMNSQTSSPEDLGDWAEKKNIAKNLRYENHRSFLEEYSDCKLGRLRWICTQANFTVGVRGSIKSEDFDSQLASLGIQAKIVREVMATRTVRKTLELSDAILTIFLMAIKTNPKWAKQSVSETLEKTSTERNSLFKRFTWPTSGFDI